MSIFRGYQNRTRSMAFTFALATLLMMPAISETFNLRQNIFIAFLWVVTGIWVWTVWYKTEWIYTTWLITFLMAALYTWQFKSAGIFFYLFIWGLWYRRRTTRSPSTRTPSKAAIFLLIGVCCSSFLFPNAVAKDAVASVPPYLRGYKLREITSCFGVDKIPWKFIDGNRQSRLLFRDELRLTSEERYYTWEVHQVVDKISSSFIFRRALSSKSTESFIFKDYFYNRVIEQKGKRKKIESSKLLSLLNRPAFTFIARDGTIVTFTPGDVGYSVLTIEHPNTMRGRLIPPIYIKRVTCDRPEGPDVKDVAPTIKEPNKSNEAIQLAPTGEKK